MHTHRHTISRLDSASPRRRGWLTIGLLFATGCVPPSPDALGPALTDVLEDGGLTCDEHASRDQYNQCPQTRPSVGTDPNGVTWAADRFFLGLIPNPLHPGVDCYRGTTSDLGVSSYQCCYEGDALADDSGTFDFVSPFFSFLSAIGHLILDVLPAYFCAE